MSAGQTIPLLRHAARRFSTGIRTGGRNNRHSRRLLSSSTTSVSPPKPKGIQTWQAVLLGSLATVALQGALLYGNAPPSANASASSDQAAKSGVRNLEDALDAIHKAGVKTSTVQDVLQGYATAPGTSYPPSLPLALAYPTSTSDVVSIVNACRDSNVPIIPVSGRTSLEGQTLAVTKKGSAILVSFDKMNNILEVNEMNGDAVVQAGVQWEVLNEHLADQNIPLFFPIDPGPGAAFGGMIGCGGSGTAAVRFGSMKGEYIVNATVVLPSGKIVKTRSRARKSAMGWDTTKLFIGAEGYDKRIIDITSLKADDHSLARTLGIVTECTVRLAPKLPIRVATTSFPTVGDAVRTVVELLNKGVQVTCVELLDDVTMKAINLSGQMSRSYPERPHLFSELHTKQSQPDVPFSKGSDGYVIVKFSGGPGSMSDNINLTNEILQRHQGDKLTIAKDEAENEEIWQARKGLFFSQQLLVPGCKVYITDACVPLSKLPELVEETAKDVQASGFIAPILGHSGDGNIHAAILYGADRTYDDVKALARRISARAISLEGTASGEHGVGQSKIEFMEEELGHETVELMRTIKRTLDPHDLFNPGKLLPDPK